MSARWEVGKADTYGGAVAVRMRREEVLPARPLLVVHMSEAEDR